MVYIKYKGVGYMRTNNGIAYFGGGTIKDRINNARMLDIMSIQLKISEIDSLADFDGYTGELVCYLDDLRWDKEYFLELEKKVGMLKSKGLTGVIVDVSLDVQVYKK